MVSLNTRELVSPNCTEVASLPFAGMLRKLEV